MTRAAGTPRRARAAARKRRRCRRTTRRCQEKSYGLRAEEGKTMGRIGRGGVQQMVRGENLRRRVPRGERGVRSVRGVL
eukprot:209326-Chlamydomonas_euryale.AAC.7